MVIYRNCQLFVNVLLTLLHSEWPKLYRVLSVLSVIGLSLPVHIKSSVLIGFAEK